MAMCLPSGYSHGLVAPYRWPNEECGEGVPGQVSSSSLDHGSKLRSPSPIGLVTSSIVMNPHLSISVMVSPAVQGQVPHPLIVPEFLRSTSCGMTSARGQGAIVYCLNSGSGERQTGRHNSKVEPAPH
ncbi:hypothetical protein TNCV_3892461 [Trichonephila clavipes]|nr:hypothetical protein TNCV_3892461 [Trichonephila clavipes]